jgi:UDP:flavonoid glycosyltransferase YjiC (YdhE family)
VDALFESQVRENSLDFAPISADPMKPMQEDMGKMGNNPVKVARWMSEAVEKVDEEYFESYVTANESADLMICSSIAAMAGIHIAAYYKTPVFSTALQPVVPTTAYPYSVGMISPEWLPFLGFFNRSSYTTSLRIFNRMFYKMINRGRENLLGMPPLPWKFYKNIRLDPFPMLHAFSRHVLPFPADYTENQIFTGYWFLDSEDDWQPPVELAAFLEEGDPPVYLGFGSMLDQNVQELSSLILEAMAVCGKRAVILGGWTGLGETDLPDTILKLDAVPHDWLFPRMAAVVHHGGAGTTAAGLRAGKPSVIVPYISDQPFWGWRVEKLGVGPKPIPRSRLTAEKLAAAITQAVKDQGIQARAAVLGEKIRAENGVGNAVQAVEEITTHRRAAIMPSPVLYGE